MRRDKLLTFFISIVFLGVLQIHAQDDIQKLNLSKAQQALLKNQKELIKKNRAAFKATLTKEQLAILNNKALTKQQRQNALRRSLTLTQKNMLANNRESVKQAKVAFRRTLTKGQRQRIKNRMRADKGQSRNNIKKSIRDKRRRRNKRN